MTRLVPLLLAAAALAPTPAGAGPQARTLTFSYTAHDGATRTAYVVLPASYPRGGPALAEIAEGCAELVGEGVEHGRPV